MHNLFNYTKYLDEVYKEFAQLAITTKDYSIQHSDLDELVVYCLDVLFEEVYPLQMDILRHLQETLIYTTKRIEELTDLYQYSVNRKSVNYDIHKANQTSEELATLESWQADYYDKLYTLYSSAPSDFIDYVFADYDLDEVNQCIKNHLERDDIKSENYCYALKYILPKESNKGM